MSSISLSNSKLRPKFQPQKQEEMATPPQKIDSWIEANKECFVPPVCNKLMHGNGQLKVMYVGGPNVRADYHIEEGEELFYMHKGDMCVKIMEHGKPKDVHIKEGEVFLLPGRIPHSPQRPDKDSIGLVIERERLEDESDGLRYYIKDYSGVLFEEWFHCFDLGVQLKPVIDKFFASEQYKTGKPIPDTIVAHPPLQVDIETSVHSPFSLEKWLKEHHKQIDDLGHETLFSGKESTAIVYGKGSFGEFSNSVQTWIWQLKSTSTLKVFDRTVELSEGEELLIDPNTKFSIQGQHGDSRTFVFTMQRKH